MRMFLNFLCCLLQLLPRCEASRWNKHYTIDMWRNVSQTGAIRVAASASLDSEDAFMQYSHDMVRAWDFFTDWLNAKRGGVILNGSSYTIAFHFIEDYSNKTVVTEVYKSLLPSFDLFYGPYSASLSKSAADVTDPAGKFLLAAGTNTAVFKDRRSTFTTLPPNLAYLENSFAALAAYGAKTTAVIKDTDFAGCGTPEESNSSAINAGLMLYKHFYVDPLSSNYSSSISSIIAELKKQKIETVMGCTYLGLCYEIMNSSRIRDYNPQGLVFTNCLDSPDFMRWAGKNARGIMMPTVWEKSLQLIDNYTGWTPMEFSDKFKDAYGYTPTYHAANAFSSGEILMDAIEKSQSLDPLILADTLRKSYFETIFANVSFDSNNQITADLLIVQAQHDLTYTTIYPKFTEGIYPMSTWTMKQCEIDTNDCSGHGRCSSDGQCICDGQYYGKINVESCDTYCSGERAYDAERRVYFCKNATTFHIGAVTIADALEETEYRALLRLAVDLINNKTDGYFDNTTAQVFFEVAEDRWECSSEKGYAFLESLDLRVQNATGSEEYGLSAVIEPDCSLVSEAASIYGDRNSIIQFAFGATAETLSDKNNHPFFARSCPSDAKQSDIIVELLYYYGLKNISVVSVSDDTYSSSLASMTISRYLNHGNRGNVIHHESYPAVSGSNNASFYDAIMDRLASYGAAVTVLITASIEAQLIFDAASRHNIMSSDKYLWVGPNDWVSANLSNVPLGSLGVTIYSLNTSESVASKFMSLWRSLDPSEYPDQDGDRSTLLSYSSFAVDAVFALALAFQQTINSNYVGSERGMRQDVYERLVNSVVFDGVSGFFDLDANGDREGTVYQIRNYQSGSNWAVLGYSHPQNKNLLLDSFNLIWPDGATGAAHGSAYSQQYEPECPAGSEPRVKDGLYYCELCEVGYYKPSAGNQRCGLCPEGTDCNDVGIVVPCILRGYWRPQPPAGEEGDFKKWSVFRCDVSKRCLGGCDLSATCAANVLQTSPVCGVCMEGYYATGETCSACPSNSSYMKAAEIAFVVLVTLVVFCLLLGLYASNIRTITDTNIFVVEKKLESKNRSTRTLSEAPSKERLKKNLVSVLGTISRFVNSLHAKGLSVTVKLALSFVQVLLGTLPRLNLEVNNRSSPSWALSVDLNLMNYVPIISECTPSDALERPFAYILLILFLPVMFIAMIFFVRSLVSYLMRLNAPSLLSSRLLEVDSAMFHVTLQAIVWFCLVSFPFLASGTLSFFDCRDMGEIGVYMREDYSVRCDDNPSYSSFLVVAVVCVLLYPIGIPVFFYRLIRGRDEEWARIGSKALHSNFLPEWAYFEVFELFRKLLLTSIVAFVMPGTATQVMYLFAVDMLALLVLVTCRPYASDPDDFLSSALVLTECALFFVVFLIVSEVYIVENYSREGMMNTGLALLILALAFFVPMNAVAKIPSVHHFVESWSAIVTAQLSKLGIKARLVWKLDARSRYQQEIEELRVSYLVNGKRLSQTKAEGPGVGWDEAPVERIGSAPPVHESRGGRDDDVEVTDGVRERSSEKGISVVENPVQKASRQNSASL